MPELVLCQVAISGDDDLEPRIRELACGRWVNVAGAGPATEAGESRPLALWFDRFGGLGLMSEKPTPRNLHERFQNPIFTTSRVYDYRHTGVDWLWR